MTIKEAHNQTTTLHEKHQHHKHHHHHKHRDDAEEFKQHSLISMKVRKRLVVCKV